LKNQTEYSVKETMSSPPSSCGISTTEDLVRQAATELVAMATIYGFVLTIEQRPLQPFAMGHYDTVVSVRPKRTS
jgi:hypothetical protein